MSPTYTNPAISLVTREVIATIFALITKEKAEV